MKYYIREDEVTYDSIDEVIDHCIEDEYHKDDDYFEEWVNDRYGYITINGQDYNAFDIICEFNDDNYDELIDMYCESCNEEDRDEAYSDLENAEVGDVVDIQYYTVEIVNDECDDVDDEQAYEDALNATRSYINEQKANDNSKAVHEKKVEDDVMSMFQVIK